MKKIIALAVASAFVAPVYAADVTIGGDMEFNWKEVNGTTTGETDGDFNIKVSGEAANGISVSADFNVNEDAGNDGGSSLTIAGEFGKIDMGDTSSAVDAVDDATDWGFELTNGSPNHDAHVLWTLPTMVPNLAVNLSLTADANEGGHDNSSTELTAGSGVSAKYSFGAGSIAYGKNDHEDNTSVSVVSASYSVAGVKLGYELFTSTTAAGVDTDTDLASVVYTMGDTTIGVEMAETSSAGTVSADITVVGLHQNLGGGLVAFIEQSSDDQDATADTTAMGLAYTF
jgi:hypothetical protein